MNRIAFTLTLDEFRLRDELTIVRTLEEVVDKFSKFKDGFALLIIDIEEF